MHVFISYSHADKAVARRIARRLLARGTSVWIDEREVRVGSVLDVTIEDAIRKARAILVVASEAAAQSRWVKLELTFARTLSEPRPVCPVFVEHVQTDPLFANDLGVDAMSAYDFESVLQQLASAFGGSGQLVSERMRADLVSLTREEPALNALVDIGLHGEQGGWSDRVEGTGTATFHGLEFALCTLYDLATDDRSRARVARYSATSFRERGAGTYVLAKHSQLADDKDIQLTSAVGETLDRSRIDAAIRLLSARTVPDDHALLNFIAKNGASLDSAQRDLVLRLATHPYRPPAGFAVDVAYQALAMAPDSEALRSRFQHWIMQGEFDGLTKRSSRPEDLLWHLGKARERALKGWQPVEAVLISHVRALARSRDRPKVFAAADYLFAASPDAPHLVRALCDECESAIGAAEWKGWEDREEMVCLMLACTHGVQAGRSYAEAFAHYQRDWQNRQRIEELRSKLDT